MDAISLKVPVTIKAKLTEKLKAKILGDLEEGINRAELEVQQLNIQEKRVMQENQPANPDEPTNEEIQRLQAIQAHFGQERQKRLEYREEALGRKEETEKMVNGQDIDDGTKVFTFSKYIESLANKSGYLAKLKKDDEDDISRHENIMELVRVSQEFAKISLEQNEPILLRGFVERASLSSSSDQGNKNAGPPNSFNKQNNYVSLMTLHLAKGLEFDYVFITGLEDGLLPHSHSMMDAKDLEEERRLFYVGLTRAKLKLFLTYATSRNTYGRSSFCGGYSSRFLDHIPNNLLEATT